jgi:hypothetical protein
LVRLPIRRAPEKTFFHSRRAAWIRQHQFRTDPSVIQQPTKYPAVEIVPDHAGQRHVDTQSPQQHRHTGRSAEAHFTFVGTKYQNRCFRADPLRIAPRVAIQYRIAKHQCLCVTQTVDHTPRPITT